MLDAATNFTQGKYHFNSDIRNFIRQIIYFILSSEINAYQKQIKVISITSEMI